VRPFVTRPLPRLLHRVGWAANPAGLRPWNTLGPNELFDGRFDDPTGGYRTLYASATAAAALREKLAPFRADPAAIAVFERMDLTEQERASLPRPGEIPASFLKDFALTTLEVTSADEIQVVDVTAAGTFDAYADRTAIYHTVADILNNDCTLAARKMGLAIWRTRCAGVVYPSKFGSDLINYALFETDRATDELVAPVRQLSVQALDDACIPLRTVAEELGLRIVFPPREYDVAALWVQSLKDALSAIAEVKSYDRAPGPGVRYYSMRIPSLKIGVVSVIGSNQVDVEAITPIGGADTVATTVTDVTDVFRELARQDGSVAAVLDPVLRPA
jgi:RES domain